jgi:hypothetical protein
MADPDLSVDPDAQMAYMQLWAAHPELGERQLTQDADDDQLWREFAEFYAKQSLPPMEPDPQQDPSSRVVIRTGIFTPLKAQARIQATTLVTPEVAAEILKNVANKQPPFRPELGKVGQASWFISKGNPYTSASPNEGKTVTIKAEVAVHPNDLVFNSADLVKIRDSFLTPAFDAQTEADYRRFKEIPPDKPLNSAQRKGLQKLKEGKSERLMWEEVANRVRASKTEAGIVKLVSSEFSVSADGDFYVTTKAQNTHLSGGVAEIATQIVRDNPAMQVPETVTRAVTEELKRLGQVAKVKTVLRIGGRVMLVVGILADGYAIYSAEDRVKETVRVVGGWTGAFAAGAAFSAFFAPADVAGPWAWVAHGAGALVAGGIGYWAGSTTTVLIYEVAVAPTPVAGAGR